MHRGNGAKKSRLKKSFYFIGPDHPFSPRHDFMRHDLDIPGKIEAARLQVADYVLHKSHPLYLEVFQLLLCLFRRGSSRHDLRLGCLVNLALCLLGGGVFREIFGVWDEIRGAGKVLSEWLGYSEALSMR